MNSATTKVFIKKNQKQNIEPKSEIIQEKFKTEIQNLIKLKI